jgi:hypothetical protein
MESLGFDCLFEDLLHLHPFTLLADSLLHIQEMGSLQNLMACVRCTLTKH